MVEQNLGGSTREEEDERKGEERRAIKNAEIHFGFLRDGENVPGALYFRASFRYWSGEMPNTDLNTLAK